MKTKIILALLHLGLLFSATAQVPTDGLIAYWTFKGSAQDVSNNGHNGQESGVTVAADRFGEPNTSYLFDGDNDYVNIGSDLKISFPISFSFWIKTKEVKGQAIILLDDNPYAYYGPRMELGGLNEIGMTYGSGAGWNSASRHTIWSEKIPVNKWTHIIGTIDANNQMNIFINGQSKPESYIYNGNGGAMAYSSSPGSIGKFDLFPDLNFNGNIDDIRIYNKVLTESEILNLLNEKTCTDTVVDEVTTYHVSSTNFKKQESKIYYEHADTFKTKYGQCDSVVNYYSKYVYTPVFCSDSISVTDTLIIKLNIVGLNNSLVNTLKVYPNPTKDILFINTGYNNELMDSYKLKIISQSGLVIFESFVNQDLFEIDLSEFGNTGLYLIQVINEAETVVETRKIILE